MATARDFSSREEGGKQAFASFTIDRRLKERENGESSEGGESSEKVTSDENDTYEGRDGGTEEGDVDDGEEDASGEGEEDDDEGDGGGGEGEGTEGVSWDWCSTLNGDTLLPKERRLYSMAEEALAEWGETWITRTAHLNEGGWAGDNYFAVT